MEYKPDTYLDMIKKIGKSSDIFIFVDGPRRCGTNYTRTSIGSMLLKKDLILHHSDSWHDPKIFIEDDNYLHNKNIVHIVPIRNPKQVFISAFMMYGYDEPESVLTYHKNLLLREILNFIYYFNLPKKYKNVILCPIEIFNNNEILILNLINKNNNLGLEIGSFNKDKALSLLPKFEEYGENGLIKFHSYPIKEQEKQEYKDKKEFFENLINNDSSALLTINALSNKYEVFLEEKKKEWGI
jgi:hypothetical protein